MRRFFAMLLSLALLLGMVSAAVAEGNDCTITLVYQNGDYANDVVQTTAGTKLSRALTGKTFKSCPKYIYGVDFEDWYLDADCTTLYDKSMAIAADMTLYANWQPWNEDRKAMMDAWLETMDQTKLLLNHMPVYTADSFTPFLTKYFHKWESADTASWNTIEEMKNAMAALVPVCNTEDVIWDIWGEQIPQEDTSSYDLYLLQDAAEFKPCLTAFLLPDQSQVKGNIVICSGGGFTYRGNDGEGYPTALHMNALGYNCYVLQYRLSPYAQVDALLDLQRAIRYIRYHAEEKGIARTDNMATIGFSAGGFVVCGQATTCYGDILPTAFYPDYVCDDIDLVNADIKVAAPVYGLRGDMFVETANEHLPALFLAVGTRDGMMNGYVQDFLKVQPLTPSELHVYDGVPHGFGMADRFAGADQMDEQFDAFLTVWFELDTRNISNR